TPQVIGDVALATLAGGPCRIAWCIFFPLRTKTRLTRTFSQRTPPLAFGCAPTLPLSSIALGSLIATFLEILRLIPNAVRNNANASRSRKSALALPVPRFPGDIENMARYFNGYAYIEMALYGKPYTSAARDTWNISLHDRDDALANDSLVSMTPTRGVYAAGRLCSLFAYLYLHRAQPLRPYNAEGQHTTPVVLLAFLIGLQCCMSANALSSALEAGVSTM
ncbi:hypothetical protein BV22DRAFT_1015578, partial [Leucogyrophana mollusca]